MTASRRLVASGRLRHLALAGASELETSRALLAELSGLLSCYYRRAAAGSGETLQRVGPAELRVWWLEHQADLVELHRELARAHLIAAGVEA